MSEMYRLPAGGCIARDQPIAFTFDGKSYTGCAGDTLASALLANGKWIVGRSWKYHRPRGIVAAGVEEPNAIFQLGTGAHTVPNARATQVALYQGLVAQSVSGWPGVEFDALAATGWLGRLFPAGFYYKTFMWPAKAWPGYERMIRRLAGLGTAPAEPDPDVYEKRNAHCDVLVAGGGPAGLMAALAAGRAGARVIVADLDAECGGSLLSSAATLDGRPAREWVARTVGELAALPEVHLLTRSTVFGYHDQNFLTIAEQCNDHLPQSARTGVRERIWRVRARRVVLATGAHERPLVFAGNDRPGIVLASALATYIRRYAVLPGRRIVVATNNDAAYDTAFAARNAGAEVTVVDAREAADSACRRQAAERGIRVLSGSVIAQAHGRRRVEAVSIEPHAFTGSTAPQPARIAASAGPAKIGCDVLAVSGGYSPVVHLHAQSGGSCRWDEARAAFIPATTTQAQISVGSAAGTFDLDAALREGWNAGAAAALACGFDAPTAPVIAMEAPAVEQPMLPLWRIPGPWAPGRGPKAFVDLQNDVTVADIFLAAREGYESIEHVKRYTALGFGTDQGKLGNINGMAILAEALGQSIPETGTTTFRPNYTPVTFGAIAGPDLGEFFEPVRKTALHARHAQRGAVFEDVGQWKRPWYYPRAGETMDAAVRRECRAVRNAVGIFDGSTLGKIDIQGPDAATLLDWIYCNNWKNLAVGRCRYGLMLGEDGMVMDDGVTARLGEHRFLMTTTTGGAARVLAWMERWLQTEWPQLEVYLTSVTDVWATIALAGPASRATLQRVCGDVDFAAAAFPFMHSRDGTVAGVAARIARISFSGELAFEINVPADHAGAVWDALLHAGEPDGIAPYGTEAMHVLRAEKGYIIVGQDTDGSVTPVDLGLGAMVAGNKDCIGKRSLARSDMLRPDRRQWVGLLTEDPLVVLPEGGQLVPASSESARPQRSQGHVTSAYYSNACGRSIALGLLERGRARIGETLFVAHHRGAPIPVTVAATVFHDPEGLRQHG